MMRMVGDTHQLEYQRLKRRDLHSRGIISLSVSANRRNDRLLPSCLATLRTIGQTGGGDLKRRLV